MEQKTKHREWIKTAAIIFLSVLLILTFFSNTIMNHSLPEVATKAVQSGSINAQIRGTGNISADETYDVTISQSRKIQSVLARVGDEVRVGDTLFVLDAQESAELQTARDDLENMELAYQKSLISDSNTSSQENRDVQKLREAYNKALATYQLYSNVDPSRIESLLNSAELTKKALEKEKADADKAVEKAKSDKNYTENQSEVSKLETEIDSLNSSYEEENKALSELKKQKNMTDEEAKLYKQNLKTQIEQAESATKQAENSLATAQESQKEAYDAYDKCYEIYGKDYEALEAYAKTDESFTDDKVLTIMEVYARPENDKSLENAMIKAGIVPENINDDVKNAIREAFHEVTAAQNERDKKDQAVQDASDALDQCIKEKADLVKKLTDFEQLDDSIQKKNLEVEALESKLRSAKSLYYAAKNAVAAAEAQIERLEAIAEMAAQRVDDQAEVVSRYSDAQNAAQALTTAKEALEDKLFAISLANGDDLDLKKAKEDIEKKNEEIAKLEENSDAVEVTSKVNGIISAVSITAGNTASADVALATITIKDRGYTVRIPCTAEQARRVTVGDQAKLSNYYYYS
ncbi:MAG: hypothetical protein IKS29_01070, partial [Oscillospiraceae bacterium]|nr:hypothetical protein [Oscillospiraceae bacterium]